MPKTSNDVAKNSLTRCKPILGTFVEISLQGYCTDDELIQCSNMMFNEIERIHHLLGFHDEQSELSALNRALLTGSVKHYPISSDMKAVLVLSKQLYEDSGCLFDVSMAPHLVKANQLPNHLNLSLVEHQLYGHLGDLSIEEEAVSCNRIICIDFGGIAKGYAVDLALALLPAHIECTINAGGDMCFSHWHNKQVSIQYGKRTNAIKTVPMTNKAVATSGNYLQSDLPRIIHPLKGIRRQFSGSVSVFAENTMLADALTKVVVLCKPVKATQILKRYRATAIIINRFGFHKKLND